MAKREATNKDEEAIDGFESHAKKTPASRKMVTKRASVFIKLKNKKCNLFIIIII